jgi:hypothetical protein
VPIINKDGSRMQTANLTRMEKIDRTPPVSATHLDAGAPRRAEAESFIRTIFKNRYGARVSVFAPRLLMLEQQGRAIAAAGWRGADTESLFLERYLDAPVEQILAGLTGQTLQRQRIVEVGNLASEKPGGSLHVILNLARDLDRYGYEWVVFTATQELIRIFTKLGLPLLALAKADPARLGSEASDWGSYYETAPVVVAGRIRIALERFGSGA